MSRASLREKEAVLQVGHEESLHGPLHIPCLTYGKAGTLVPVMRLSLYHFVFRAGIQRGAEGLREGET